MARRPIVRVVITEGGPGSRKGTRWPWVLRAYDERGDLRSGTEDFNRAYIERKAAEWFPGVPVEYQKRSADRSRRTR